MQYQLSAVVLVWSGGPNPTLLPSIAKFLAQPAEDFVFCLPNPALGHSKLCGCLGRRPALNCGEQEGLPGNRLELRANRRKCLLEQALHRASRIGARRFRVAEIERMVQHCRRRRPGEAWFGSGNGL